MLNRISVTVVALILVAALATACGAQPTQGPATKTSAPATPVSAVAEAKVSGTPAPNATQGSTQVKRGGTLTMSMASDFTTFDPFFDADNNTFKPVLYDAPLRIADDGKFELWLAESIQESLDGLSVTLRFRKGVKFHNGREMTADDVVWSVDRARDNTLGHHLADRFTTATGATKLDDYTVKINFSEVTPGRLNALAGLYIFPKEAAKDIATKPVGTGPFKFQEWVPGDRLTLVKNADYWRQGEPYLDKVVVKPLPDAQSRVVSLLGGNVELLRGVALSDRAQLAKSGDVTLVSPPPGFSFYAFIMNVSRPPLNNPLVRQALNYAVDRDKINKTVFSGEATMTTLPYGPLSWAYPKDLEGYYKFDLEKAKQLLAQAGYPNGIKTSMLIRGTGGAYLDMAQVYKADLAKIGVELEIIPIELAQYWPKLYASDFDMVSHATGDANADPSGLFQSAAAARPFRNFFKITDDKTWFPKYAETIKQAGLEQDQQKRQKLYHDALQVFVEQGWTIPVAWNQDLFAFKNSVKGFRTDLNANVWLNQVWLAK
ncbi:MAG: ABC transporter substrate-binding protein [Chloroflexota bacterium]